MPNNPAQNLVTVARKDWTSKDLVFYVGGSQSGGSLSGYGFRISVDAQGDTVYSIPPDDEGPVLANLFLVANGKFRVTKAPLPLHSKALIRITGYNLDSSDNDRIDISADCDYTRVVSEPVIFRVVPVDSVEHRSVQDQKARTVGAPDSTLTTQNSSKYGSEVSAESSGAAEAIAGKIAGKSTSERANQASVTDNTGTLTDLNSRIITQPHPFLWAHEIQLTQVTRPDPSPKPRKAIPQLKPCR
jgi:hypothetical protein